MEGSGQGVSAAPRARVSRIAPLDGLRAIAVLGVLYAHIWSFALGCPPMRVGRVDVNRLFALFGTGVDLFFVISGFCMYLMYGSKQSTFSWASFGAFVANRFRRIAPAFYVALLLSAVFVTVREHAFPAGDFLTHVTFVSTVFPGTQRLAASFWSLAAEWHFYLVLPLIVAASQRFGFRATLTVAMVLGVLGRVALSGVDLLAHGIVVDHWLAARFVEFGWGIIAARIYLSGRSVPRWLASTPGFVFGWAVSLVGRAMMTAEAGAVPFVGRWLHVASLVVLSFGYMLVVLSVVTNHESLAARALASPPMRWVGRISYSVYLLHWDIGLGLAILLAGRIGIGAWSPLAYTAAATAVILPLAELWYRWFEAPYFRKRVPS